MLWHPAHEAAENMLLIDEPLASSMVRNVKMIEALLFA